MTDSNDRSDLPTRADPMDAAQIARAARAAMDGKVKPLGSLGRLEEVAVRLAVLQGTLTPSVDPARVIVFAADHGVAAEGVSAYPAAVTAQMVQGFVAGGAAVAVLAASQGVSLRAVDIGVDADLSAMADVVHAKVRRGSANLAIEAAMSHEELDAALQAGREAVVTAAEDGCRTLCLGEMGIANTTSAAVLTGVLTGSDAASVTGRGTGIDDERLQLKRSVVARAMARTQAHADDPLELLREAGGLEIAALVGAMMEAPAHRLVVLVDGYIVTAAALVALKIRPTVRDSLLFAHRSAEPGHAAALAACEAEPLLDLGLRLGEGSGAMLALPLLRAAVTILTDMATFTSAGVSGPADEPAAGPTAPTDPMDDATGS